MNKYIWIAIWLALGIANITILYIKGRQWNDKLTYPYKYRYNNYQLLNLASDIEEAILVFSFQYIIILILYIDSVLNYWG